MNRRMESSEVDGGKKGVGEGEGDERCGSRSSGESINKSGSDERPVKEILKGDDEEKKKSVYVVMMEYPDLNIRLWKINPHDTSSSSSRGFQDITPKNPPTDFKNRVFYQVAALEPNLYFIGGYHLSEDGEYRQEPCSSEVLVFNTLNGEWDTSFPPMKLPRPFPHVLTYDEKIYVFGYDYALGWMDERCVAHISSTDLNEHWAEFYDPKEKTWSFLESVNSPPFELVQQHAVDTAVCKEQQCILFLTLDVGLYGYKVDKRLWFKVDEYDLGMVQTSTIAVHKCFLFRHLNGTIYANRLHQDSPSSELLTLPNAPYPCGEVPAYGSSIPPQRSFLLNAGNSVFGLLYQRSIPPVEEWALLEFHMFVLQHSPQDRTSLLHSPDYRRTLPVKAHADIIEVLVM